MRKNICATLTLLLLSSIVFLAMAMPKFSIFDSIKREGELTAESDEYKDVRIRKFPIAIQCYTFRKYSFLEALEKASALGLDFVQAYPDQILKPDNPDVVFDHNLSEEDIQLVKSKLNKKGLRLIAYGVVDFENAEEAMRKVFDFAKKLEIRTVLAEPEFDDYSLLERLVKEYDINVAIHNHPAQSKYARPEAVLERIKGLDERIGAWVDTGHWMRSIWISMGSLW